MIYRLLFILCCQLLLLFPSIPASAHFGMVIPSDNIITWEDKSLELELSFSHPFEGQGMDMARPEKFYVVKDGKHTDLLGSLQETRIMEGQAWQTVYKVKRPGVYQFVLEPQPYWEEAEGLSIIHYTKTLVAAFGAEQGWKEPVGLPVEIIPMLRPFGNYAGNTFTGKVVRAGEPVPWAEVEVEYYDSGNRYQAPTAYHITQVVQADEQGIFSFTCPEEGWWGFAALSEADYKLKNPAGEERPVELGAVLWVHMDEWQDK
ncbi:MAG: DUF4198 domain-containing protein [Thermodesulfobacteriota bacterium]